MVHFSSMLEAPVKTKTQGTFTRYLGVALVVAGFTAAVADIFGWLSLRGSNVLLASGGAIAFGIILSTIGLVARLQETRENLGLAVELQSARRELIEALALSNSLAERIEKAGISEASSEHEVASDELDSDSNE